MNLFATRLSTSLSSLILAGAMALPLASSRSGALETVPTASAPQDKALTLEGHMKAVNKSMKQVRNFLKKPTGDAPVALVIDMQKHSFEAKLIDPKKTPKEDGKEKVEFVLGFKKEMRDMIVMLLDLELALDKKDWVAAGKLMEELDTQKSESHKVYKAKSKDDEEEGDGKKK